MVGSIRSGEVRPVGSRRSARDGSGKLRQVGLTRRGESGGGVDSR
jgi:hypothetical protein